MAAAVTHRVTTPDVGNTANSSGAFTPAVGDFLVVFLMVEASLDSPGNLTSSVGGFTFTQARRTTYQAGVGGFYVFVADALVSSAVSQTVTTTPTDAGAGSIISVYSVSGMTLTGLIAVRRIGGKTTTSSATTPNFSWDSLDSASGDVCLGAIANSTNPAGISPPASWSESQDTGYTTGAVTGLETAFSNSGETGSTITWGSNSATSWASLGIELNTTPSPPPVPPFRNTSSLYRR